ncbi:MAG: tetratricopeptide repeat protein [Myxococcota bacterium]
MSAPDPDSPEPSRPSMQATIAGPDSEPSSRDFFMPRQEGDRVGRYVILGTLGAGGMGVVYSAYDPQLDRKIALKVLHPHRDPAGTEGRQRLVREAQAMAKLAHPNVAAVHDVGEHEREIFVAMEFIKGQTLRDWLKAEPRDPQRILEVFIEAGRGLWAAHQAQLLHRDFKPENVMVGAEGRVWVLDFGLVRPLEGGEALPERSAKDGDGAIGDPTATTQTRLGAIMGTPAYMSPEQLQGTPLDARSDQFSFCVALYEALYEKRPFIGASYEELVLNVIAGDISEAPRRSSVPGWLRRVLLVGLRPERERRHASMLALLDALQADPSRRRRRWLLAGGAVALAAGLWGARAWTLNRARLECATQSAAIDADWDDDARQRVEQALLSHDMPFASESWNRVRDGIDDYVQEWKDTRLSTCEAQRVDHQLDAKRGAAATSCLTERRAALQSLISVLSEAELEVVIESDTSVYSLPAVDTCTDDAFLSAWRAPTGSQQERAIALREEAVRAEMMWRAGQIPAARVRIDAALADAQALGDTVSIARLETAQGAILVRQGDYQAGVDAYRRGYFSWGELGDTRELRGLAMVIASVEANLLQRPEIASDWLAHAGMHATRTEGPALEDTAGYHRAKALIAIARGDYEQAKGHADTALQLAVTKFGPDHPRIGTHRSAVITVQQKQGHYETALEWSERELERVRRVRGPEHPSVARALTNVATLLASLGKLDRGLDAAREAVALCQRSLGPEHPWTLAARQSLASVLSKQGNRQEAIEILELVVAIDPDDTTNSSTLGGLLVSQGHHERASKLLQATYDRIVERHGASHPSLLPVLINLGAAHRGRDDDEQGAWAYNEAIRVGRATLPSRHPTLSFPIHNLGKIEYERKRLSSARALFEDALAIRQESLGADNLMTASSLQELATLDADEGHLDAALERAEQALAILRKANGHPDRQAQLELLMARVLMQPGARHDRPRALQLARRAKRTFIERDDKETLAQLEDWLVKYRIRLDEDSDPTAGSDDGQ